MPDNYKISELTTASQVKDEDYVELSQEDSNVSGGRISLKTTILAIANKIATAINFSGLTTTSKNLVGAINEAASAGGSDVEVTNTLTPSDTRQRIATVTVDEDDTDIYADDAEKVVKDMCSDKTYTGNPVTVESVNGGKAKSCEITMNPIQDLHGQSAPYPTGGGKNKLPLTVSNIKTSNSNWTWSGDSATYNGITIEIQTDNGGNVVGLKATGTNTSNSDVYISINFTMSVTGNYIGNGCADGGAVSDKFDMFFWNLTTNARVKKFDGTSNSDSLVSSSDSTELLLNSTTDNYVLRIRVRSGYSFPTNGKIFTPMIRLSTVSDATFAPYSNICPISGRDGLNLTVNDYFDKADLSDVTTSIKYFPIKVGDGNFTMSTTCPAGGGNTAALFFLPGNVTSGQSSATNGVWDGQNRSCDAVNGYITVAYRTVADINPNNYISHIYHTDKMYETHTATFSDTIMGGSYDFVSGDGMANLSNKVDLGSLTWTYDSNGQRFYSSALSDMKSTQGWNNLIFYSENYKKGEPKSDGTGGDNIIGLGNKRIYIRNTQYTDAGTFKTDMSGYYVCYELATPTEITLTAEQIELLKGTNTLWTDGDNISLTMQALEFIPDTGTDIPLKTATAIVRPKPGETNGDHIQISTDGGTTFEEYYYNNMNGQSNAKNLPPFFRIWYASPYWYIQARTYTELDGVYYFPQETVMVQQYDAMYQFEISGIVFGN